MKIKSIVATAVMLMLTACAATSFKSTWKSPKAGTVDMTGKKVLVVASKVPTAVRTTVEAAVADELKKMGADAMPSNQYLSSDTTIEAAKAKLASDGYDAAWVVRMTNREQEISSTPGMYTPMGPYNSYWGWGGGYGYGMYSGPDIRTDTKVYIETLVYSVKHDELAWSGMSVTTNPTDLYKATAELTRIAIEEMKKTGLLR